MKNACTFFIDSTSTWEEFYLGINGAEKSRASATFSFLEQDAAGQVLAVSHLEDKVGCGESCWGMPAHGLTDRWAGPFQTCWEPVLQEMIQKTITSTIKLTGNFFFFFLSKTRDWWEEGEEGMRNYCLMVTEFQFGKMNIFWRWMMVMAAQQGECT